MEELKRECRRTVLMLGLIPVAGLVGVKLIQYMNLFTPLILHTIYICVIAPIFYAFIGNRYGFFDTQRDSLLSFFMPAIPSFIMCVSYAVGVCLFSNISQSLILRTLGLIVFHYIIYAVLFIILKSFMWDVNVDDRIYGYNYRDEYEEDE